jgi:hypothetical protein
MWCPVESFSVVVKRGTDIDYLEMCNNGNLPIDNCSDRILVPLFKIDSELFRCLSEIFACGEDRGFTTAYVYINAKEQMLGCIIMKKKGGEKSLEERAEEVAECCRQLAIEKDVTLPELLLSSYYFGAMDAVSDKEIAEAAIDKKNTITRRKEEKDADCTR